MKKWELRRSNVWLFDLQGTNSIDYRATYSLSIARVIGNWLIVSAPQIYFEPQKHILSSKYKHNNTKDGADLFFDSVKSMFLSCSLLMSLT